MLLEYRQALGLEFEGLEFEDLHFKDLGSLTRPDAAVSEWQ